MGDNWVPRKLEVDVAVPEALSLERFRSSGPQPGEARALLSPAAMPPRQPCVHVSHVSQNQNLTGNERSVASTSQPVLVSRFPGRETRR